MKKLSKAYLITGVVAVGLIAGVLGVITINNSKHTKNHEPTAPVGEIEVQKESASESDSDNIKVVGQFNAAISADDTPGLQAASEYIALVQIDSIDGGLNYAEISQTPTVIASYGKMTVVKTLKGDLPAGATKTYYRMGGTMDLDEYCQHANQAECEKLRYLNPDKKTITYAASGDVELESGKTYLAFMRKDNNLRAAEGYIIMGLQNGLRVVQTATGNSTNANNSEVKVLNNWTGAWENLSEVVKNNAVTE